VDHHFRIQRPVQFGVAVGGEGIAVTLGVDSIMDMARTTTNVTGNCLASVIVARWEGEFVDKSSDQLTAHSKKNQVKVEVEKNQSLLNLGLNLGLLFVCLLIAGSYRISVICMSMTFVPVMPVMNRSAMRLKKL